MPGDPLTRRRALGLLGAAAGLPLVLGAGPATAEVVTWRGRALGAPATLILHHPDRAAAERLVAGCVAELDRLEAILSLYRPDSTLSELNRTGALAAPPPELVAILVDCRRFHALTAGAFDPTVQPLWRLYARHFAAGAAEGPPPADVAAALATVGLDGVRAGPDRIALTRPGMALTLNGIAQGWITDRIADRLRAAGVTSTLVDMGEIRGLGPNPWQVGVAGTDAAVALTDRAIATSAPRGFAFDAGGRFTHIIDPRTGATPARFARITVTAPTAAEADALSTGFALTEDAPAPAGVTVERVVA